jgi:hypothetical protein
VNPVVRAVGVYFPANGRFYVMGGRASDAAGSDIRPVREYNPATNTWTVKNGQFGSADINNMACGVLTMSGTAGIVCAGGSAGGGTTATSETRFYDPVADTMTVIATDPYTPGNSARLPGGFAVHNNKLYTIGGFEINVAMTNEVWEFDPARAAGSRWLQRANMPAARGYVPATTIGNFIYTAGGSDYQNALLEDTTDSFRYDPVANVWTTIANIPRATAETRAVTLNGEMWVLGGGRTAPNPSNEVNIYNPGSNSWRLGPPFMTPRRNFPADSNGTDRIWLVGGYAPTTATASMEIFQGGGGGCPTGTVVSTSTTTRTATSVPTTAVPTTAVPTTAVATSTRTATMMPSMTGTAMPSMTRTATMMPSMTAMTATRTATMGTATATMTPCSGRVTICHRTGNGNSHTISISCNALPAHMAHGDTVGECPQPTPRPESNRFSDVNPSDYFYHFVLDLNDDGAVGGYSDGTFRPYNNATRGQFVKIAVLAFHIPLYEGNEQHFTDVPQDHTFYKYIETARRDNIIGGYADGTFRPFANVTRGQLAKIAVESARMENLSTDVPSFSDVPVGSTFYNYIETAYANGILSGYADGTFRPNNDATRGQVAKIINLATHPSENR